VLQTKQLVRLSQQELMDCSWGEGNNACDGGEDFRAYQWIMKHGLASEEDYGPYLAVVSIEYLPVHCFYLSIVFTCPLFLPVHCFYLSIVFTWPLFLP